MKIKFVNANRDARFNSYLPEVIAEALLRQIKQKKPSAGGADKTSRAKQDDTSSKGICEIRNAESLV